MIGRVLERVVLDAFLESVRAGGGGALVVRGETGTGKTSLLDYVADSSANMRVLRATGVRSEMEFAHAALHQLCAPLLEDLAHLPAPQRDALETAFGIAKGRGDSDPFLVGVAVLSLLSEAAELTPILLLVDDAQSIDRASARSLAFVARRIQADGFGIIFSVLEPSEASPFEGIDELWVGNLSSDETREVFASRVRGPLDPDVLHRMVEETEGNPLAIVQVSTELSAEQFSGAEDLPESLPLGRRLEESVLKRMGALPRPTRELLLLVAAERAGDADLLWRAAASLGITVDAVDPAEAAGFLEIGPPIRFRQALVRSAVYSGAALGARQQTHRALADAIDPSTDPDRRAWHRAAAMVGVDEEIAAELEGSARRARDRGGYAASAALLRRAAQLSPDASHRIERTLAAARSEVTAGAPQRAAALLEDLTIESTDAFQDVEVLRIRGEIALQLGSYNELPGILDRAEGILSRVDEGLAREIQLEQLMAAAYAGHLGSVGAVQQIGRSARSSGRAPPPDATYSDLLLDGLAALFTEGHAAAVPSLRKAIGGLLSDETDHVRWLGYACHAAAEIWEDEALITLGSRWVDRARETGAYGTLPSALAYQGMICKVLVGRFDEADLRIQEAQSIYRAMQPQDTSTRFDSGRLMVAAWRGREGEARAFAESSLRGSSARGNGGEVSFVHYALAVLGVGLGKYEMALTDAQEASDHETLYVRTASLSELVEAAARSGELGVAADAVLRLADTVLPSGTEWGLGILARSRALLASHVDAESHFLEAIDRLQHCRAVPQLARAKLLYGEWLRRARRQRLARAQLQGAYSIFIAMGAEGFAERARVELLATGEHARSRSAMNLNQLTPQEMRIAGLVADGSSNNEIATQLFISRRTVEYHLTHVYAKLGVTSRTQLGKALARPGI